MNVFVEIIPEGLLAYDYETNEVLLQNEVFTT